METKPRERTRQCIACRRLRNKKELLRIVRTPEGQVETDPAGKKNGRGAYLCRDDISCLEKALKRKSLEKTFGVPLSEDLAQCLREEYRNGS